MIHPVRHSRLLRLPVAPALATLLWLVAPACGDCLFVTEVVTDPEQDHSESSGGNGTPYDAVSGSGTISSVDEFVELFNAGTKAISLKNWVLQFVDSSPAQYEFGVTTGGHVRFSAGSMLDALQPGGFVLLGNPPGALNNSIRVVLRDPSGVLADEFDILNGAATGTDDEAVTRGWSSGLPTDQLLRAPISPLALPTSSSESACGVETAVPMQPAPEPGSLFLVGASLLAAYRASAGRVRRARHRSA